MSRYYTRVCNFYYGSKSKKLIKSKKSLPLSDNDQISFDKVEIITRSSKKKVSIKKINDLPKLIKKKNNSRFKKSYIKKKKFC